MCTAAAAVANDAGRRSMMVASGVFLFFSHLVTAVIERDPWHAEQWLTAGAARFNTNVWLVLPAIAGVLCAWLLYSWHHSLSAAVRGLWLNLFGSWGRPAVGLFLLFSLLPQRVMDNNSGYICLTPDNPVWYLLWLMDWARALFSLELTLRLLALEMTVSRDSSAQTDQNTVTDQVSASAPENRSLARHPVFAGQRRPSRSPLPMSCLVALSIFSLFSSVCIHLTALDGIPHVQDEIIQEWHARLLESGKIVSPEMSVRSSFRVMGIGDNGKSLFSTYQPLFALLLSTARRIGAGKLLNPVLGISSFWLLYLVLRRSHGEHLARTALCIGLISPFAVLMQSSLMNHVCMSFLLSVAAFALDTADRGKPGIAALLSGLALGLAWMTRRVDCIALHGAWLISWFILTGFSKKRVFLAIGVLSISAAIFSLNMRWFALSTGDSAYMIRHGQAVVQSVGTTDLTHYFANLADNLCGLGVFAFGGILAAFVGLGLLHPLQRTPAGLLERFLLLNSILVLIGYTIYDYQDFCFGPRFFFGLLPLAAVSIAMFLHKLDQNGFPQTAKKLLYTGIVASVLFIALQAWSVLSNEFWHITTEFSQFVRTLHGRPRILFVTSPTRQRLELARYLQAKWNFSGTEIIDFLSHEFIDTVGLRTYLEHHNPSSNKECMERIEQHLEANRFIRPTLFGINIYEVPRVNSITPLEQEVVVAIDRGDCDNTALIEALPDHEPLLIRRTAAAYFVEPYRRAGVESFDDLLVH